MDCDILVPFIRYLEEKKLVRFELDGDDEKSFENRVRIQKYVFLAKRLGLDVPFKHSVYMHGPFSESLKSEYDDLSDDRARYDATKPGIPESFREAEFLDVVRGRDARWLEVATTLIDMSDMHPRRDDLVECVQSIEYWAVPGYVPGVMRDLEKTGLIRLEQSECRPEQMAVAR